MPEMPEVETIRRQLEKVLIGQTITDIQVLKDKSFHGDQNSIIGCQVINIRRFGKALVIDLEPWNSNSKLATRNSKLSLVIHLKMTGQLIYEESKQITNFKTKNQKLKTKNYFRVVGGHPTRDFVSSLPSKHTRVVVVLEPRNIDDVKLRNRETAKLFFNDQRFFGWIKVIPTSEVETLPFIQKLGSEPAQISKIEWKNIFQSTKKPVKLRLLDQEQIVGLGNIYANDTLWMAGIDPQRPSNSLKLSELNKLHQTTIEVLNEGIKHGGATAADGKYIDLQGLGGKYQNYFKTYQRAGKPCLRCKTIIKKNKLGGRGTFYCPKCQK